MKAMQVKTAAPLYDVSPAYLSLLCRRGDIPGAHQAKNGRWYVPPESLEKYFLGIDPPKVKGKVASK